MSGLQLIVALVFAALAGLYVASAVLEPDNFRPSKYYTFAATNAAIAVVWGVLAVTS